MKHQRLNLVRIAPREGSGPVRRAISGRLDKVANGRYTGRVWIRGW